MILSVYDALTAGPSAVGGKAWNLGRLTSIGERVPDCFVIDITEAQKFAELAGVRHIFSKTASIKEASYNIRKKYLEFIPSYNTVIDSYMEDGLAKAPGLRGASLAVRSSALFEDMADASSAGQHDSFLRVNGRDAIARAVVLCWASQWTERAIHYRRAIGVEVDAAAMAVVVQRFIPAEKAGVMFTVDPVRGAELLIEAVLGTGDDFVAGRSLPERLRIERGSRVIWEHFHPLGEGARTLSDAEVDILVEAGLRIEHAFGRPQDIEWAFEGGRLYVLQARPITTGIAA